ncbi:structural cement protein Gp24 [Acinetobacter baumannii]|uniref:structural cement protein Gp24 n=1 Tax=Acinetobacter baumannii TaxID=470 RepID=UPI000DE6D2ED|nr:hypothetical protein [Acinetobacter baumannii]MCJ9008536.1 hypothetical protein [Acinetobacter baumannii]MCJ9148654.1 hypothetical protein [Acinetobacter baumannii]MCJ9367712.1 hypothetical protein [Acinetobacter baumannii]MCJ9463361.1 hypothetical protein [Acinetobacter baumannii]MDP7718935.1 hypothetical protein [Acinetobacter baumannii]
MVKQYDAVPGMKFHLIGPEDILSLPVAGTGLVNDGDVVVRSTDGKTVSAVTGATNTKFGIIVRHGVGKSGKTADGKEAYKATDVAPVMTIGPIYVKVTAPVTDINAKVYVKTANGTTAAPLGSLSPTATDGTELPNASWETISNEQGLAAVRLRGA